MSLLINLVSYWSFDSLLVDVTGTNTLTNSNGVTQVAGLLGNAASFTAASLQTLQAANNASLVPTGSFTFDGWLKPTGVTNNWGVMHTESSDGADRGFRIDLASSTLRFFILNSGVVGAASAAISANVWTYFRAWYDAGTGKANLQLNNGTINQGTATSGPLTTANPLVFGGLNLSNGAEFYNGLMDEIGYWSRVLTSGEATARYNSGVGLTYPFGATSPEVVTTSGAFTFTAQSTNLLVAAIGGGGGADAGGVSLGGEGGGGGEFASLVITGLTPNTNYSGNVGAGGAVTVAGGDSWFVSTSTVKAKGGSPGAVSGGAGGTGGIGTTLFDGGAGGTATTTGGAGGGSSAGTASVGNAGSAGGIGTGGAGGAAPTGGGAGGNGGNATVVGNPGSAPGGGGGGGGTTAAGAAGGAGQITLSWPAGSPVARQPMITNVSVSDAAIH